ncbi:type II secretion system pilot lipoprotein GspS-beta [Salmonella enterica]
MTYKFIIIIVFFFLSGCVSSKQEDLSKLIQQRYDRISSQLPIQNGKYILVKVVPVSDNTIQLLIVKSRNRASSATESKLFLSDFSSALCEESQSKEVLLLGGKYQILLQETEYTPISLFVDKSVCHYV